MEELERLRCEHCGEEIREENRGQVAEEGVICLECLLKG